MGLTADETNQIASMIRQEIRMALQNEIRQLIQQELQTHINNYHQINAAVLQSKIAGLEAANVLDVECHKLMNDKLKEVQEYIEDTLPDELGRAQDLANEAKKNAEAASSLARDAMNEASHKNNYTFDIRPNGGDIWTTQDFGGGYGHTTGINTQFNLFKALANQKAPAQINALTPDQYDQMSMLPERDNAVEHIEKLFKTSHSIKDLVVTNDAGGDMRLRVGSDEREVVYYFNPVSRNWDIHTIKELALLEAHNKTKKKGKKKNANSSSK